MSLTREEEIERVAGLARIRLRPEQVARFAEQLGRVTEWMETLGRVEIDDTSGDGEAVAPEASDVAFPGLDREVVLTNAPAREPGGHLVVPRAAGVRAVEDP